MANFDLNIENYSSEELYGIVKIKPTCQTYEISIQVNKLISSLKDSSHEYDYVVFLKDIETRLKNERKEKETKQLLETYASKLKEVDKMQEAYVNQYPKGTINPIDKKTLTQVINIDSLFRTNYDNTDACNFIYTLAAPINNVITMRLSSLEIPNIWYDYSSEKHNNKFTIMLYNIPENALNKELNVTNQKYISELETFENELVEDEDDIKYKHIQHTIIIPDGNYSTEEFEEIMNNYFTNIGNGLQCLKFEISETTGKTILRCKNKYDGDLDDDDPTQNIDVYEKNNKYYSPNFNYILDFGLDQYRDNVMEENCGWSLGFRTDIYSINRGSKFEDSFHTTPTKILRGFVESEGAYGTSMNNYFFLSVDDFNQNFKNSIIADQNNSILGSTFIARIPISAPSNSIMNDNGGDRIFKTREYFGPVKIERLKVQIVDKYGKKINLNKNDFSFTLECTQIY